MANIYDMADTWNDGATTFTAIKMDVTNTASASSSLLMDLQVGGVSQMTINKAGITESVSGFSVGTVLGIPTYRGIFPSGQYATIIKSGNAVYEFGAGSSGSIKIPGANRNEIIFSIGDVRFGTSNGLSGVNLFSGTNAQTFNIYNTYTDASNYERAKLGWNANVFEIKPEAAGTGTTRVLHISGLPTTNPGPGILWNNAGTPAIGT